MDLSKITGFLANLLGRRKQLGQSQDQTVGSYSDAGTTGYGDAPVWTPPRAQQKHFIGLDPNSSFDNQKPPLGPTTTGVSAPPSNNGIFDSPEVKNLLQGIQDAQGVLSKPAPAIEKAKIDPAEAALSLILGGTNHFAAGKTLEVPGQLAQGRADEANQAKFNQFNIDRQTAQQAIGTNSKLIDYALDRDAVSQRVEAQLKAKEMEGVVKREVAQVGQNTQLIKTLANLEGSGGITAPAVAAIYQQMGYDADQSKIIADNVLQSLNENPSLQAKVKMAQQETNQAKAMETQKNDHRKVLLSPNATYEDRLNSIMALGDLGDPRFANMTFDQMQSAAMVKGAQTLNTEAKTKQITDLLPLRIQKFQADIGLSQARAEQLAKRTSLMDDESAAKVAKAYADIDNIHSLIGDREKDRALGYARLDSQRLASTGNNLRGAMTTLSTQSNALRSRVQSRYKDLLKAQSEGASDEDLKAIQDDINGIGNAIRGYQQQYGDLAGQLKDVNKALGHKDTPNDPNAPVNPFADGVITPHGTSLGKGQSRSFGKVKVTRIQ